MIGDSGSKKRATVTGTIEANEGVIEVTEGCATEGVIGVTGVCTDE